MRYHHKSQDGVIWSDATALAVAVGSVTEAITYTKSASLHLWLLGYEFTGAAGWHWEPLNEAPTAGPLDSHLRCFPGAETVLVFTKAELHALAGPKKTDILAQLSGACTAAGVALRLHPKPKKEDGAAQIESLLSAIKDASNHAVVGMLPKVRGLLSGTSVLGQRGA